MTEAPQTDHVPGTIKTHPVEPILLLMGSTALSLSASAMDIHISLKVVAFLASVKLLIDGLRCTRKLFYSWGWI